MQYNVFKNDLDSLGRKCILSSSYNILFNNDKDYR